MLRATLPSSISFQYQIEGDPGIVEAVPSQIHQILMNLCANAEHAMRESGGILEVRLSRVELDESSIPIDLEPESGPYLRLSVSDTGHGMMEETRKRIFDPYFTTKKMGEGTGLGLAVVHGIVKNHGGFIEVVSEPGRGSTFHVHLPIVDVPQEEIFAAHSRFAPGGNERILLVDDEEQILNVDRLMLESLGYEVETAASSTKALEIFRADPARFDLVITDMTMPHMTGDRLAKHLMDIRSDLPVILCTGFSHVMDSEQARKLGIRAFLTKPLKKWEFPTAIRGVLDGAHRQKPLPHLPPHAPPQLS